MKKLFFSFMAVAAIASCAKTERIYTTEDSEIRLSPVTSVATKADYLNAIDGVDYPVEEEFRVNAYWTGTTATDKVYLRDVVFTKDGDYWAGQDASYYWPKNGTLRFACYSPATVPGVLHEVANDKYTVDFTQSNKTAQTIDFMIAPISMPYTAQTAAEDVSVVFEHTLAWLTIKVKAADDVAAKAFTIRDVIVEDVFTRGTLTAEMHNGVQYEEWTTIPGSENDYVVVGTKEIPVTASAKNVEEDGNGTLNGLVVIPQVPTTLTINYTQNAMDDGHGNQTTPALTGQSVNIPLALDLVDGVWEPGKHYIYTVIFDLDEILVNPSVADWDDEEVNKAV